jgi:predicted short-subunit dehydrogenase-like oxidoreductase (DUF2520 family)
MMDAPGRAASGRLRPGGARPSPVAIIGAGRVGTVLGVLLERAGYRVVAVSGRRPSYERAMEFLPFAKFLQPAEAARLADVVILSVPDDLIEQGCASMAAEGAFRARQFVSHTSGSVPLDALDPAAEAGATVFSLHPLQTFPDVAAGIERMPGSPVAVSARDEDGYVSGEALAETIGGHPFRLPDEVKPLYHAAAVFSSNYLVVVQAVAEQLMGLADVDEPMAKLAPLARAALDAALALEAARIAARTGELPPEALDRLEGSLSAWT